MEFRADYESFKNGYAEHLMGFLRAAFTIHEGLFFDYTSYFSMHGTHPSPLERIKTLRGYLATNS